MDNIHAFQNHDEIMDEAYAWVLLFNADTPVSDKDIAALKEWSARSPVHREALKEAEAFWCEAELLSQLAVPAQQAKRAGLKSLFSSFFGGPANLMSGVSRSGSDGEAKAWFGRAQALAAVLFLGFGIVLLSTLTTQSGSVGNGVYSTAVGEQTLLTLRDNSQVQLDTDSQVRIEYQEGVRQIYLLRGKAHFDVAKNPQRPFEVFARGGLVRAVGTAFSVFIDNSDIEVVVDEGRVDLERLAETEQAKNLHDKTATGSMSPPIESKQKEKVFLSLDRGQSARFNKVKEVLAQLDDKDLAKELAWRKGVLVFARDSLGDVVYEVSRYTSTTIEIVDPELRDLVMGGRFRVGELDALLEVLEIGFGVQVSYLSESHIQLRMASNE